MIIKELTIHIYGKLKNMNNKIKGKIKDTKQKILLNIIQSINRYFINLPKDTEKENSHGYEDLMPKIDVEKNKQYCESIEWALKNYEIKNIALTGVYGSGKSTILKTYKSQHNEYKYLNISLASFKDEELEKESNGEIESVKYSKGDIDNIDIEKAILKQIFYKEKYKTIPYSRFKRINNINEIPIIGKLILILATIFFGALFFNPHLITNIRERLILVKNVLNINKYLFIFLVISFAVIVLTALVKVIKYIKNRVKISIIKTGAGEIEIDNSDKSVFNKYIDEILYFFEVTKYDVVIFEDLDRFNNIEIFSRLRELNLLINNSEQINKRVVFIYALRDDMFSNKDNKDDKICYKNRTKFFDFIIPVLQVANSSNACDVLFKKFQKFNELDGLSEDFISDVTFLINDMRILNNIYNEYIIYKENLNKKNEIDNNNLLAIIVYKNMYPVDFSKLQNDEGIVYNIFHNKYKVIKSRIIQIDNQIDKIERYIEILEKECANNLKELRKIYMAPIMAVSDYNYIHIEYTQYKFIDLINDENEFEKLIKGKRIQYHNGINWVYSNSQDILSSNTELSYAERKESIKLKEKNINSNIIEDLKIKLEKLNKEKRIVSSLPLKDILNKNNFDEIFEDDISEEDLLIFLIKNGYIDENYYEYISYFYEGTLTKTDKDFLTNVMYEKCKEFDYVLNKPESVLKKMHDFQFRKEYVLNYCLVDFIIENKETNLKYKIYYELLIEQLVNESKKSFEFIDGYMYLHENKENNRNMFIKSVCNRWVNMWVYIQIKSKLTQQKLDSYLKDIIQFGDLNDIENMNSSLILTTYISQLTHFLKLISDEKYFNKIERLIERLDVKFKCIEKNMYEPTLLDFVYKNNRYDINEDIIELIIEKYSDKTSNDLRRANYTTIRNSGCEFLIEYIENNINEYIENVFLKLATNVEESENTMIDLLKKQISHENKYAIIEKERVIISDITSIDKELWDKLILNKKVNVNWFNIITYYSKSMEINKTVFNYLNEEEIYIKLSKLKMNDNNYFEESVVEKLSLQLIKCKDIKEESFKELLRSMPYRYDNLDVDDLSDNRINNIIKNKNLNLTLDNYNLVKEHYISSLVLLIIYNMDVYLDNPGKYKLNSQEINRLLDSSISKEEKISIIQNIDEDSIAEDMELINKVVYYVLNNDIYLKEDTLIKIIESEIEENKKIMLINKQINSLDKSSIFRLLKILGGPYAEITKYGKRPLIKGGDDNKQLAINLYKKKCIRSHTVEKGNLRINTFRKEKIE